MSEYVGTGVEYCFRDNRPIGYQDYSAQYTNIIPNIIVKYPAGSVANHDIFCSGDKWIGAVLNLPDGGGYSSHQGPDSAFRMPSDVEPLYLYHTYSAIEPFFSRDGNYDYVEIPKSYDQDTYIYYTYPNATAQSAKLNWLDMTNYGASSGPAPEIVRLNLPEQTTIDYGFNLANYSALRNVNLPALTSMKSAFATAGSGAPPYTTYPYKIKEVENVKFGNFSAWGTKVGDIYFSTQSNASGNDAFDLTAVKNVKNFSYEANINHLNDTNRVFEDVEIKSAGWFLYSWREVTGATQAYYKDNWSYGCFGGLYDITWTSYPGGTTGRSHNTARTSADGEITITATPKKAGTKTFPVFYNVDFGTKKKTNVRWKRAGDFTALPEGEYLPTDSRVSALFSGCTFTDQTHFYLT